MIKVRMLTIKKLRKLIKKGKRIVCFGAGGRLNEFVDKYAIYGMENYIDYIVDNDSNKWKTVKKIGNNEVIICSPDELKNICTSKHILLLTLSMYEEVIKQIESIFDKKITCYQTPIINISGGVFAASVIRKFTEEVRKLPLKNVIYFPGWGDSQRENEMTLRNYLIKEGYGDKYKIVWQTDEKRKTKVGKYIQVCKKDVANQGIFELLRGIYYRKIAKYVIAENHFIGEKRIGQIWVYMNHGAPPLKKTKEIIKRPKDADVVLCSSEQIKDIVKEQFNASDDSIVLCGAPRFDNLSLKERFIDKLFDLTEFDKVIMWVPTFRQHRLSRTRFDSSRTFNHGIPIVDDENDFQVLNKRLKELGVGLIIKPHPLQDLNYVKLHELSNILFLFQKDMDREQVGVNCLIKDMDAIITDYSTIAFDYMLKDRPIGYTVDDMEDYTVGFSVENPLDWMPGNHMRDMDELMEFIESVSKGEDNYKTQRNIIRDKVHMTTEANNCEKLVELLELKKGE